MPVPDPAVLRLLVRHSPEGWVRPSPVGLTRRVGRDSWYGDVRFAVAYSVILFVPATVISGVIVAFGRNPSLTALVEVNPDSWAVIGAPAFRLLPQDPLPGERGQAAITSEPNMTIPKSEAYFNNSDRTLDWRGATIRSWFVTA